MKSLVALLDRKKRDRANTLVQVPFPSALSHSSAHQDGSTYIHGARRTSSPSSFLRPLQQQRVASDTGHVHRPLLSEPSPYYPGYSPAQSASYYTDSDDGTFVDPFAPSPSKLNSTSKLHSEAHHQVGHRRGSEPNSSTTFAPSSYRFRPSQGSNGSSAVNESKSQSVLTAPANKKGRWLRERRSLTSLLRPQQSNIPAGPVPAVPPLPTRVPERRPSLFFARSRSGSIPSVTQTTELAHTVLKPSIGPESVQLPTSANAQPRSIDKGSTDGGSYRGSVPLTLMSHSQADSPDSWVRVDGTNRDSGFPTSPTTRRRAISVPLPLPQPRVSPPPVPDVRCPQYAQKTDVDRSNIAQEPALMRRPGASADYRTRRSHNAHGIKSASVSVPAPARLNAGVGTVSRENERPVPQHSKQSSVSTVEGLILKSALKHRPTESIHRTPALPVQSVKPLRICKREGGPLKIEPPQLLTTSSDSSLKALHHASSGHIEGAQATTKHHKNTSGSSSKEKCLDATQIPIASSVTAGSFSNIMKGHGLPGSDSRSLPILDNIWGSFISETAFGSSLPPSPVASITARFRATQSQETNNQKQIGYDIVEPKGSASASCSLRSESHWKPGSAPPSSPPLTNLPPVPKPPLELALSLGHGPYRKGTRSSANATALLTPPTSPTEELQPQGLDCVIASSVQGDTSPNHSSNKCPTSYQHLEMRLARSASSPSIRPSMSPEIGRNLTKMGGTDALSRKAVKHQNSRSISPSLISQSSSQCTPVPGTPIALSSSVASHVTSYPGTSNGALAASGPSFRIPRPRKGSGDSESSEGSVMGISVQPSGTVSEGVSGAVMGKFPPVPSNQVWPNQEEKTIGMMVGQDPTEGDPHEEPLLTPPVTPAWPVHVFDTETGDNLQFSRMEHDAFGDHVPLARLGNLAQMRRQKRGDMRSVSTQLSSRGSKFAQRDSEKADTCRNKVSNNATFLD